MTPFFSYGYNSNGQRTSVTEASGDVVSYGYDGLLHLSSESRTGASAYTALYVVDGVGNRTSSTAGGVTTTYTYDSDDELTATSGGFTNSYGYNANGDQTTRKVGSTSWPLSYDFDNQLTTLGLGQVKALPHRTATSDDTPTGGTTFTYDAAGRRVSRTTPSGVTTNFLFDGGSVLLEKQGSTTTGTYTYGNALVRKDGKTPLFDGLGSARTVTDGSQAVTASLTPSAFGQTVASSGSSTSAYGYGATSGYRSDGDAGLTLVGCRYYDAQVGRFITRDTYLDQAPYAYCDGDPVNAVDPSGHFSQGAINGGIILGGIACGILLVCAPEVGIPLLIAVGAGSGAIGGIIGGRNDPGSTLSHAGQGALGGAAVAVCISILRYALTYTDTPPPPSNPPPPPPEGVWPPPPTGP